MAGEDVHLTSEELGYLLVMTMYVMDTQVDSQNVPLCHLNPMFQIPCLPYQSSPSSLAFPSLFFLSLSLRADVADQQYGWQDDLFGDAQWRPQEVVDNQHGTSIQTSKVGTVPPSSSNEAGYPLWLLSV